MTYPDGSRGILAAGGLSENSCEFLDIDTLDGWVPRAALPYGLGHGASVPYNDSFLIVGGFNYNGNYATDEILFYNPERDSWDSMQQSLDDSRTDMPAFLVPDEFANCN